MSTRPVSSCKFDTPACGIDYSHSAGGERKGDVFYIEQDLSLDELQHKLIVLCH
jgi:hypothetical protein